MLLRGECRSDSCSGVGEDGAVVVVVVVVNVVDWGGGLSCGGAA